MLLKVEPGENGSEPILKNMHVPHYPEMGLFQTQVVFPKNENDTGKAIITYNPPSTQDAQDIRPREVKQLEIPLHLRAPSLKNLKKIQVIMHQSPTAAYDMGARYNDWFSECFGYPVVLAFLGRNSREVLGSMVPDKRNKVTWWTWCREALVALRRGGILLPLCWIYILIILLQNRWSRMMLNDRFLFWVPVSFIAIWIWVTYTIVTKLRLPRIGFSDCAPFLVISQTSIDNVSARLPEGEEVDHTKFRPNIVVSGADSAFEEDYWTELQVGPTKARLLLTGNCVRCQSLNVDYQTGKMAEGETGTVLKKLMKDRRVDTGARFSPVFGRYSFLHWTCNEDMIRVGDEVDVVTRGKERTVTGTALPRLFILLGLLGYSLISPILLIIRLAWSHQLVLSHPNSGT